MYMSYVFPGHGGGRQAQDAPGPGQDAGGGAAQLEFSIGI